MDEMVASLVKFLRATIGTWHHRIQCPTVLSPLAQATQGKHGQVSTATFWLCTLAGSLGSGSATAFVVNAVICLMEIQFSQIATWQPPSGYARPVLATNDEWHVASPLSKGCSHRVSNFHTPFRHDISSTYITAVPGRKMFTFQIISMIKRYPKKYTCFQKCKVDDKASSKTHLVRLMHNVVTSKFKSSLSWKPDVGIPDSVHRLLKSFQY